MLTHPIHWCINLCVGGGGGGQHGHVCIFIFKNMSNCKISQVIGHAHRADSRLVPSQWETSLQSNVISHWLGADPESAVCSYHFDISVKFISHWKTLKTDVALSRQVEFYDNTYGMNWSLIFMCSLQWSISQNSHWNGNVVILIKFPSFAACMFICHISSHQPRQTLLNHE